MASSEDLDHDDDAIRVFISYSHDSERLRDDVLELAHRLRTNDGIDATIDSYVLNPQDGWPSWQRKQIADAHFCIVICTEAYARIFEGKSHTNDDGAAWQVRIIEQLISEDQSRRSRFIPVSFEGHESGIIPTILRGNTHYTMPTDYDAMIRYITDQPESPAPPMGTRARRDPGGANLWRPEEAAEYRRLLKHHEVLDVNGFASRMRMNPRVRQVFVPRMAVNRPLDLQQEIASQEHLGTHWSATPDRPEDTQPLARIFESMGRWQTQAIVLLGDPGSGKTTQLKWMLLELIDGRAAALSLAPDTLPIFLNLREVNPAESMTTFVRRSVAHATSRLADDFAERLLKSDHVLFLFDGLDEIARPEQRAAAAKWIDARYKERRAGHYFIVTCRHTDYMEQTKLGAEFLELHLAPLGPKDIETLVMHWHEIHRFEHPDAPSSNGRTWADDLLEHISSSRRRHVAAMAGNPLLLTAICMVRAKNPMRVLPDDISSTFQQCMKVLLETWPIRIRNKRVLLHADQALAVLQPVAYYMQRTRIEEATRDQLHEFVTTGLARAGVEGLLSSEVLPSVREASGLLVGSKPGSYRFVHRSFREYLAALELRERPEELESVAASFDDPWWREVFFITLASCDSAIFERFMRTLARQERFTEWVYTELMDELLTLHKSKAPWLRDLVEDIKGRRHGAPSDTGVFPAARGGVRLVFIPGGRFLMGSPRTERGRRYTEGPQHEVELAGFYLARTPVTNEQYREYLVSNPEAPIPRYWGDRRYNHDAQPVVGVSWMEAKRYCEWAGLMLPTEAQWEYASRAGTSTRYHSGDLETDLARVGWYAGNSGGRLHAVAELEPNGFGLYDMHGNTMEWCEDAWPDGYEGIDHRRNDGLALGSADAAQRVIRGGVFGDAANYARCACRHGFRRDSRLFYVGFRPALESRTSPDQR
jgi:formylglycine-generating enzyme required for sulfatase activity